MENYFNYFTEIEERFQQRRGTALLLSTLDWALIETWKDAGIPLEAVLRGIDAAFDRWDARPSKTRKVNSLAYCSQEVLAAAEDIEEASLGSARNTSRELGLESIRVANFLQRNAAALEALCAQAHGSVQQNCTPLPRGVRRLAQETSRTLRELSAALTSAPASLEDLERRLTVMEEKLFAGLLAETDDAQLVAVRADADRELAPYRRKMPAAQIEQLHKQYVHKRLLERYGLPRLSLFYM